MSTLVFPSSLRRTGSGTPCVYFTNPSGEESYDIYLPMPVGFQVNDGAGWSNFDTGLIPVLDAGLQEFNKEGGGDVEQALRGQITSGGESLTSQESAVIMSLMSKVANGGQAINSLAQYALVKNKAALNPNTVLSYTNAAIRSFSLTFKMVAESKDDSDTIKNILHAFRKTMYGNYINRVTLGYPDLWSFRFKLADSSTDNPYMPKTADCYITGLSQVSNPSGNAFHWDGAPAEVEFSLQMQEYRVLNRGDIEELETGRKANSVDSDQSNSDFNFDSEFNFDPISDRRGGTLEPPPTNNSTPNGSNPQRGGSRVR